MRLTREMMREVGSETFFELKKYKFYDLKVEDNLTTLSLFGDTYQFFFDSGRKIAWMRSKHHFESSRNFKLLTKHKDWSGIFSFPRSKAAEILGEKLKEQDVYSGKLGLDNARVFGAECKIVAGQAFNGDKNKLTRIFGGVLWKCYDEEVVRLVIKAYGLGSSAIDYSVVWNNKDEFADTLNKAPGILPVWRNIALAKMYVNKKTITHERPGKDVINRPGWISGSFDFPEEVTSFVFPDIIKVTKTILEDNGLTPAGWRYLIKLSPRTVQIMVNSLGTINNFIPLINFLAAVGVPPRYSLVKPVSSNFFCFTIGEMNEDTLAVIRAAFTKAQKMKRGVRGFYESQMSLVLDWFENGGPRRPNCRTSRVVLDKNQRNASWDWFMRQQEIWHRDIANQEAIRVQAQASAQKCITTNSVWESALSELVVDGYKVVAITNAHDLIDEGVDMSHCVATYADRCVLDKSRIFSIRDQTDQKLATLEIVSLQEKGRQLWTVSQCRGKSNQQVPKKIRTIAEKVAKAYNNAVRSRMKATA